MTDQRALSARPRATEHEVRAQTRAPESSAQICATHQTCATERKSSARAEASRRNGAKSRGPRTAEGKARSAQNALKHGLRAHKLVLLADEDLAEFQVLEETLHAELAPEGALQQLLVARIALAAWRMLRADRMEIELLDPHIGSGAQGQPGSPGLALIRDGSGPRAFDTLLRYRGAVQAEFWRSLRALSAVKADAPAPVELAAAALPSQAQRNSSAEPARVAGCPSPNELEPIRVQTNPSERCCLDEGPSRRNPDEPERRCDLHEAPAHWNPNEPETRETRGERARWSMPGEAEEGREATAASGRKELVPDKPRRSAQ